jgi:Homeodomain-like domain-containing protein
METARQPEVKIRLRTIFLRTLLAAKPLGMPLGTYLAEIIEARAAELRMAKLAPKFPLAPKGEPVPTKETDNHRTRCGIETTAKIVLLLQQATPVHEIAERFGVSLTTIWRIKNSYAKAIHVPSSTGHNGLGENNQPFSLQLPGPKWRNSTGS